jgi:hypothetical protein
MRLAARYACGLNAMCRWIAVVAFSAALILANAAQAEKCLTVKAGIAREIGRLSLNLTDGKNRIASTLGRVR